MVTCIFSSNSERGSPPKFPAWRDRTEYAIALLGWVEGRNPGTKSEFGKVNSDHAVLRS
ncbi:MAG: hypothetical protein F6K14_17365 [Symploca sp. SIO2C1]|nr:hypothetical protein [Symploca sp. SIO2C1]